MQGTVSVTPGQVLKLLVGQQGQSGIADGGGGGGSFVTNSSNSPIIIAGGGGGTFNGSTNTFSQGAITTCGVSTSVPAGCSGNGGGGANGVGHTGNGAGLLTDAFTDGHATIVARAFINGGSGGTYSGGVNGGFGGGGASITNSSGGAGGGGYSGGACGNSHAGPGGGGGSFNSGTSQVNTAGAQTGNGQITITYIPTITCTGTPRTFTYTVNPIPAINNLAATVCSAGTFTVSPVDVTNGVVPTGTTYSWPAPSMAGITGTAAGTNAANISGTLTNTTAAAINIIYTVTPTSPTGPCTGSSFTVTVTVNPKPAINNHVSTICSSGTFTVSPVNITDGIVPTGTTYSWPAPSMAGITGTAAGTNAANISGTLTNTTAAAINVIYTVTPTSPAGSCAGSSFTVTVTVNPKPAINNQGATICTAGTFTVSPVNITDGIVPAGTTYSWTAPSAPGITGTAAGTNAANISGTLTNTKADPENVV